MFNKLLSKFRENATSTQGPNPKYDLSNFKFVSNTHSRYENGAITGTIDNCWRLIDIKANEANTSTFLTTIYILDNENLSYFADKVQMSTKQMKIIESDEHKLVLRGFGTDPSGARFDDYGLTLIISNNNIIQVILKLYDRDIELRYSKKDNTLSPNERDTYFQNAFGRNRKKGWKTRSLQNFPSDIASSYLIPYQKAIILSDNKKYSDALSNIDMALNQCDIDDWRMLALKANTLKELGRFDDAIKHYEEAIDISSDDFISYALYHEIGYCHLMKGDNDRAATMFTHAINIKTNHPNKAYDNENEGINNGIYVGLPFKRMYINRANAYFNQNELNKSFEDCKTALSYDKKYSNPYLLISQIFSKTGNEQKAIEALVIAANLGNQNAIEIAKQFGINY